MMVPKRGKINSRVYRDPVDVIPRLDFIVWDFYGKFRGKRSSPILPYNDSLLVGKENIFKNYKHCSEFPLFPVKHIQVFTEKC